MRFAIRDDVRAPGKDVAFLSYDERKKEYKIDVPDVTGAAEAPPIIAEMIERGERHISPKWSLKWVQQRVVPTDRQNLGEILAANGLTEYNELYFLEKAQGRCCMDDCYLVKLD